MSAETSNFQCPDPTYDKFGGVCELIGNDPTMVASLDNVKQVAFDRCIANGDPCWKGALRAMIRESSQGGII